MPERLETVFFQSLCLHGSVKCVLVLYVCFSKVSVV